MIPGSNQLLDLANILSKNLEKSDDDQITKKRKFDDLSKQVYSIVHPSNPTYNKVINLIKYKCGMYLDYLKCHQLNIDENLNYHTLNTIKFYRINGNRTNIYQHIIDSHTCYLAETGILYTITNNILQPFIYNDGLQSWKFINAISTKYYTYIDVLFDTSFVFKKYDFRSSHLFRNIITSVDDLYFCGRIINGTFRLFLLNNSLVKDGILGNNNTIYNVYDNRLMPMRSYNRFYLWQFSY